MPPYKYISTHTPLAGRDRSFQLLHGFDYYFYSHAPRGARPMCSMRKIKSVKFLLTRPSRGATCSFHCIRCSFTFLLTRPSRGATNRKALNSYGMSISTHTPLAGRDKAVLKSVPAGTNFYSHAPRGARPI